jgi:hypothetical protein
MSAGIPTILRNMQIEKVPVPVGDRAEQLIANLLLSIIAAQLKAKATASEYLVEAHSLAVNLSNETVTYRPLQPSKFAHLTFDMDGEIAALIFPIINDFLVIPSIRFDVKGGGAEIPHMANLMGFDVTRVMLRIRTRKTLAILEELKNTASLEELVDRATKFLSTCLYNEMPTADPLDRANDYLEAARDLLKKKKLSSRFRCSCTCRPGSRFIYQNALGIKYFVLYRSQAKNISYPTDHNRAKNYCCPALGIDLRGSIVLVCDLPPGGRDRNIFSVEYKIFFACDR